MQNCLKLPDNFLNKFCNIFYFISYIGIFKNVSIYFLFIIILCVVYPSVFILGYKISIYANKWSVPSSINYYFFFCFTIFPPYNPNVSMWIKNTSQYTRLTLQMNWIWHKKYFSIFAINITFHTFNVNININIYNSKRYLYYFFFLQYVTFENSTQICNTNHLPIVLINTYYSKSYKTDGNPYKVFIYLKKKIPHF